MPRDKPIFQAENDHWLKWDENIQVVTLRNLGGGTAFNVASVLYGCYGYVLGDAPDFTLSGDASQIHWTCWLGTPIAAGESFDCALRLGNGVFIPQSGPFDFHLNADNEPMPGEFGRRKVVWSVARLTITYHDIFGRKLASVYDYLYGRGWQRVAIEGVIKYDLHDAESSESVELRASELKMYSGVPDNHTRHSLQRWTGGTKKQPTVPAAADGVNPPTE